MSLNQFGNAIMFILSTHLLKFIPEHLYEADSLKIFYNKCTCCEEYIFAGMLLEKHIWDSWAKYSALMMCKNSNLVWNYTGFQRHRFGEGKKEYKVLN